MRSTSNGKFFKVFMLMVICILLLALTFGSTMVGAQGKTVLYYVDNNIGTDYALAALQALGFDITVATGWTDFNEKLGNDDYDLVAAFNQDTDLEADYDVMANYIALGGRVIFTNWAYYLDEGDDFAALFGAEYTGEVNRNNFTITNPQLAMDLPTPMLLSNPGSGWGTFSMCMIPGSGVSLAHFENNEDAIILGNDGRTVIIGFLVDTLEADYGQLFFENLFQLIVDSSDPGGDDEDDGDYEGDEDEEGNKDDETDTPTPLPRTSGTAAVLTALGLLSAVAGTLILEKNKRK